MRREQRKDPVRTTNPDAFMPVLAIRAGEVPARVLVVGDPARADLVASRLDDTRQLARNREYVTASSPMASAARVRRSASRSSAVVEPAG
jgi:hypothetical protein